MYHKPQCCSKEIAMMARNNHQKAKYCFFIYVFFKGVYVYVKKYILLLLSTCLSLKNTNEFYRKNTTEENFNRIIKIGKKIVQAYRTQRKRKLSFSYICDLFTYHQGRQNFNTREKEHLKHKRRGTFFRRRRMWWQPS